MRGSLAALAACCLAGCATYGSSLVPGQSTEEDVRVAMGEPTMVREAPDGARVLWFSKLPLGRESFAATLDPDGILVSFEQRLTLHNIAKLKPNASTADDVLDLLGPPAQIYEYPRQQREAWEYPFRTPPDNVNYYVQLSPDHVVREVFQMHQRPKFLFW